jgi:hypothetical protein
MRCSPSVWRRVYPAVVVNRERRVPRVPWGERKSCGDWYNSGMTLVEVTYELQSPLSEAQLRQLSEFANTYGLRRFRLDDSKKQLSFEYDASRLRETQVAHALGQARIAVARRLNESRW